MCVTVFTPAGAGGGETRWETLFRSADTLILKFSGYQTHSERFTEGEKNHENLRNR